MDDVEYSKLEELQVQMTEHYPTKKVQRDYTLVSGFNSGPIWSHIMPADRHWHLLKNLLVLFYSQHLTAFPWMSM